jgi:hypothetical protein
MLGQAGSGSLTAPPPLRSCASIMHDETNGRD